MLKYVLFDLDGTLLPMDQDKFISDYFGRLARRFESRGYAKKEMISAVWQGSAEMVKNSGEETNEAIFWKSIRRTLGDRILKELPEFEKFYETDFDEVKMSCGFDPAAAPTVRKIREMGLLTVLATNPQFPSVATEKRMAWAGLSPSDFELFTTYENSTRCKPNPEYYTEILGKIGARADECLMVGNDVEEDMIAEGLGMKVFLMPRHLISRTGGDLSRYRQGDFSDLLEYISELLSENE